MTPDQHPAPDGIDELVYYLAALIVQDARTERSETTRSTTAEETEHARSGNN